MSTPDQAQSAEVQAGEIVTAGGLSLWEKPLAAIACALMLFIVGLTFFEVLARYLFAKPVRGASELIQFAMAILIFAAFPLVNARRGHVTVSLIDGFLKGGVRRSVYLLIDLVCLITVSVMAWRLFHHAGSLVQSNEATVVLQLATAPMVYVMSALAAIAAVVQAQLFIRGPKS